MRETSEIGNTKLNIASNVYLMGIDRVLLAMLVPAVAIRASR